MATIPFWGGGNILQLDEIPIPFSNRRFQVKTRTKSIIKQLLAGFHVYRYAGFIASLALFIIVNNVLETTLTKEQFLDLSTEEMGAIVETVSPYTSLIEESPTQISVAFSDSREGYISKPSLEETIKSPITYTVQKGDTITGIASSHGVTVSTILEANNLKSSDIESIKSGTELTIPAYNTSSSLAWLDDINKVKEEKAEAARKEQERIAAEKKKKLALASRTLTYRESSINRASGSFSGSSEGGFIVPIGHNGVSRGLVGGHAGIDYRANVGTPVAAAKTGRVIEVTGGWAGGFGNSILVDHGGGVTTRYAHLSKAIVSAGATVGQGQIIGYSGNTGFSTGPHLHFETHRGGQIICPFPSGDPHSRDCTTR